MNKEMSPRQIVRFVNREIRKWRKYFGRDVRIEWREPPTCYLDEEGGGIFVCGELWSSPHVRHSETNDMLFSNLLDALAPRGLELWDSSDGCSITFEVTVADEDEGA